MIAYRAQRPMTILGQRVLPGDRVDGTALGRRALRNLLARAYLVLEDGAEDRPAPVVKRKPGRPRKVQTPTPVAGG